jgi:hypothetical protein
MSEVLDLSIKLKTSPKHYYFYMLGVRDFSRGKSLDDNPFIDPESHMEGSMWAMGWVDEKDGKAILV